MTPAHRHRLLQAATFAATLAVLGGVFMMYTRPSFMVTMIDQLWACF